MNRFYLLLTFLLSLILLVFLINPTHSIPNEIDIIIAVFHLPGLLLSYSITFFGFKQNRKYLLFLAGGVGFLLNYLLVELIDFTSIIGFYFVSPFSLFGQILLQLPFIMLGIIQFGILEHKQKLSIERDLNQLKLVEQHYRESLLRSQIQPHFLFNALNTIYGLSRKKSEEAPNAILDLSELLRYSIDSGSLEIIPISKEFEFLQHYCQFQKKRLSSVVELSLNFDAENPNFQIPPLIFQPLIENAFKYVHQVEGAQISIQFEQKNNELRLFASNTYLKMDSDKKRKGLGLDLVQERIKNNYADQFTLSIQEKDNLFSINCEIKNASLISKR